MSGWFRYASHSTDAGSAVYEIPFEEMLAAYQARGWDSGTGMPTPDKLNDLGLDWVVMNEGEF